MAPEQGSVWHQAYTVDLCMLKMVAGLKADKGAVRVHSMRWLEQSLARGDTGRMLEPLLLSPASERVSDPCQHQAGQAITSYHNRYVTQDADIMS